MLSGCALCIAKLEKIEPFKREHMKAACISDMPDANSYAWHLTNIRPVKPFNVKGKLNFYYVDDKLIEYK